MKFSGMLLNLLLGFGVLMGMSTFFIDLQVGYNRTVELEGFESNKSLLISFGEINKTITDVSTQASTSDPIEIAAGIFTYAGVTFNALIYGAFNIMKTRTVIPALYSALITNSAEWLGMFGIPTWVTTLLLAIVQLFIGFEFLNMMRNTNKEV